MERRIEARVEEVDGVVRVLSPGVGWWSGIPPVGTLLGGGAEIGSLLRLHTRFTLCLPPQVAGRVAGTGDVPWKLAVGFGDELFRLQSLGDVQAAPEGEVETGGGGAALASGEHAIVAPTDGVFYARATPDSPPFVRPGDRLKLGQPVGLVEVMKTFNQIQYAGPGLPAEVELVDVRCEDGDEIAAGSVLMVVREL